MCVRACLIGSTCVFEGQYVHASLKVSMCICACLKVSTCMRATACVCLKVNRYVCAMRILLGQCVRAFLKVSACVRAFLTSAASDFIN